VTQNNDHRQEKARPFRLVKYFTFTSLVVIFVGSLILSALNIRWARQLQLKKSEEYAQVLIANLNHQVFQQFILPVAIRYGKIQLREKEQRERLDRVVRSTLHSFKVEMVNIYDMNNIISYSFDGDLIGKMNVGGRAIEKALEGESSYRVDQTGRLWEILMGTPKHSKLIAFAPLRAEKLLTTVTGPVLGVVEVVLDLTEEYKTISRFQTAIILSSAVVMGVLFLILLWVVNRGEKIIESRMRERFKLREQLNQARHLSTLGEMTAGISHEIRNPLGIISSSAELLKKKMAALDPTNAIPDIIVEETGRLNNIITDFLNFARPKTPDLRPCRVEQILEKNRAFLAVPMREQHHRLVIQAEKELPAILGDADMLYQAFLNILMNAMQATPEGGVIQVGIGVNGGRVSVVFRDEGQGISDDLLEKVWDPFFTTKGKGTGLGLGIVKNIVEAHGGAVALDNRPGGGACVTVALPMAEGE
jgi:signal transduction histidine kinase